VLDFSELGLNLAVLLQPSTCCKYVEVYLQSLVITNVFLGLQTFHVELLENGRRQPAMLTVRHMYMYVITEGL